MAEQYILKKEAFADFVKLVSKSYEFIAPTKKDSEKTASESRFAKISAVDDIYLGSLSYFPAKHLFFAKEETLLFFDSGGISLPEIRISPRVIFGLRRCDLNSIMHQDMVFLDKSLDPYYKVRRDASVLIGLHCKEGDKYCFCNSFQLQDFYDIMFFDKGGFYAVEAGSQKGSNFINRFSALFAPSRNVISPEDRKTINSKALQSQDIKGIYSSKEWDLLASLCVTCGSCNHLCPNCHCFYIKDDVNNDLKSGKRVRLPSSCLQRRFTRVAGNHIFRLDKVARFKHRIYHQIEYFRDRHNVQFCTGCARCIRGCPARIDWVEKINHLKSCRQERTN